MARVRDGGYRVRPKKLLKLATLLGVSRDELEADFQQFYGLDLGDMGHGYTVSHAAVLAAQLPRNSRCMAQIDADLVWSDETAALLRVVYLLEILIWQLGGGKTPKPEPIQTPSQTKHLQERLEDAESTMREVAEIIGI